jgi:hypothetical protein
MPFIMYEIQSSKTHTGADIELHTGCADKHFEFAERMVNYTVGTMSATNFTRDGKGSNFLKFEIPQKSPSKFIANLTNLLESNSWACHSISTNIVPHDYLQIQHYFLTFKTGD